MFYILYIVMTDIKVRRKSDLGLEFIVELNLIFLCIEFILNYVVVEIR